MASLLDQLAAMTTVVADTGDLEAIARFTPRDATTNPSLILSAAQIPSYQTLIDEVLRSSRQVMGNDCPAEAVIAEAIDELSVCFGKEILKLVPGRVSTEVDARLSYDTAATLEKARKLIGLYAQSGIGRERVLIKIASTWEGIKAAEILEREGIHCNLTLLFGYGQAIACAEAGVTLISPFVGRILDWFKKETGRQNYPGAEDPGVLSVSKIYRYYKQFGYDTEVMGASFRNLDEIIELAGCDLLTIAPKLLDQLRGSEGMLERRLDPTLRDESLEQLHLDADSFQRMLGQDRMASEKLDEGIRGFSKAIETLEAQLAHRLAVLEGQAAFAHAANEIFLLNDLDGDGFITREEWLGADMLFDALDSDHDGRVSPEDVCRSLGAPLSVS
ncbi:MAG: transaldolase [Aphanocapsa feldmannii 277cV]|uniref:Transaldolase n=1 Tax=Aphanocapsa feldmannii 277cV TaxID=2507553 RepID=A0A524RLX5_9CHRO|nr:MAG: transaldolase [Aphanocapsa feldmannii 277cV]